MLRGVSYLSIELLQFVWVLEAGCHGDSNIGKYRNAPPLERSKSATRILVSLDDHQSLFDLETDGSPHELEKLYLFRILVYISHEVKPREQEKVITTEY